MPDISTFSVAWSPSSWRDKPATHIPQDYPDPDQLGEVENTLSNSPPLVSAGEVRWLRRRLADVVRGKAFLLQGGDCAESFAEFNTNSVRDTFRLILQMALVLAYGARKPVIKVGRIAGQFGKPRSSPTETRDAITLPSYRGDNINAIAFTEKARTPDPQRLLRAYAQSVATLNFLRALSQGSYGKLTHARAWMLDFVRASPQGERYQKLADRIDDAMAFMAACGIDPARTEALREVEFYTSHEALLLGYEQAMTRRDSTTGKWVDTSAHMVWIGDRTRSPDGAHVEFCKGIINPIGIKCGPTLEVDQLERLLDILNPDNRPGRIVLIARFGADQVERFLPSLVRATKASQRAVVWSSDPMHGNTRKASTGFKTRRFDDILSELHRFIAVMRAENATPGGIHLEMTGSDVTECVGGDQAITDHDLSSRYHTHCDPRLNSTQALEMAFRVAEALRQS